MTHYLRATRHVGRGLFDALAELGSARMTPPRNPRDAAHRLAAALGAIGRAHALHVTMHGEIPRGTALLVSNHVSYLDPLAILPVCPAIPIAKGEIASWPIVGSIGSALGVTFVRRDDPFARARVLRHVHDLLAAGAPVLNFPEGTTTRGDKVAPFWRGTFGIAQRLGVPVGLTARVALMRGLRGLDVRGGDVVEVCPRSCAIADATCAPRGEPRGGAARVDRAPALEGSIYLLAAPRAAD